MKLYKLKVIPVQAFQWTGSNFTQLDQHFSNKGWRKLALASDSSLHVIISQYPTRKVNVGDYLFFDEDGYNIRIIPEAEFNLRYEPIGVKNG